MRYAYYKIITLCATGIIRLSCKDYKIPQKPSTNWPMVKTNFLFLFAVLLILSCHNSENKKMKTSETTGNPQKQDSASGYASVNGLNMYYEIHGKGTPLVLIHGGGSTIHTTFGRVIPIFAQTHQVIAVEMQAHGHTADIDRPLSFIQDADDIAALLKHLNIKKA